MIDRGERSRTLGALALSISIHIAGISLLVFIATRAHPPEFAILGGSGGDRIARGQIFETTPASISDSSDHVLQMPPVEITPDSAEPMAESASALSSDRSATLPDEFDGPVPIVAFSARGEVEFSAQFPRYASPKMSNGVSPGDGGLGGDGFVGAQPVSSAHNRLHYPADAQRAGIQGTVILRVRVLADGRAESVAVYKSSGFELLDSSAVADVGAWDFTPATDGMKSIACEITFPVIFELRNPR